jgi:D-serine deaminase-like pyridoxal phosphate-dependent protein
MMGADGAAPRARDYNASHMVPDLPTPAILIDARIVRRNVERMARYAKEHGLRLRPHTKTHKSTLLARMQMDYGASGLTVAKAGEAEVMASVADDILMAYPAVDAARCESLARLAKSRTVRVAVDSAAAVDALASAARSAGSAVGVLVDVDVGLHRTGVQSPQDALTLAQHASRTSGVRLDGIMYYPGHIGGPSAEQEQKLRAVEAVLAETLGLWRRGGLQASIVSGGSTPTAYRSHLVKGTTEIRPGTYVFQDVNGLRGGFASLDDCAARVVATVVSTAVPGQFVIDAGSKTLTQDRCGPAPDSGHGLIVEYADAKITKLTEEHGQVSVGAGRVPKVGERVTIVPNHICPCINLQDRVWWQDDGGQPRPVPVEARGKVH